MKAIEFIQKCSVSKSEKTKAKILQKDTFQKLFSLKSIVKMRIGFRVSKNAVIWCQVPIAFKNLYKWASLIKGIKLNADG